MAERRKEGFRFVATGLALVRNNRTYIITNEHVLRKLINRNQFYADFAPPVNAHQIRLLSANSNDDIAILRTDVTLDGATKERPGEAKLGKVVFVVGFEDSHTTRGNLQVERGVIETVGLWVEDRHLFVTSGKYPGRATPALLVSGVLCQQGGSGSPVFGSEGELLGVVKAFADNGMCLAIGIQPVLKLLKRYSN